MRRVTERSLNEGRITLKIAPSKKVLLKKAAMAAEEDGIPLSALITEALEDYLDVREEFLSELTSEDHKGLRDEDLLKVCRERLSKLKTPLSQAIAEERESR
jgi:hypothetical protein